MQAKLAFFAIALAAVLATAAIAQRDVHPSAEVDAAISLAERAGTMIFDASESGKIRG